MNWPPTLEALKLDRKTKDPDNTRDDERLQVALDAAVSFVERVRPVFNYGADPLSEYPEPTVDLTLGTIRLASRWYERHSSPDGYVNMGNDFGQGRVLSFDPDIDRLLQIGRFAPVMFA